MMMNTKSWQSAGELDVDDAMMIAGGCRSVFERGRGRLWVVLTWGSGRGAQWAARTIVPVSRAGYCRHEIRFPAVNASEHHVLLCVNVIFCNCGFWDLVFDFLVSFFYFFIWSKSVDRNLELMQNVSSSNQKQMLKQLPCQVCKREREQETTKNWVVG